MNKRWNWLILSVFAVVLLAAYGSAVKKINSSQLTSWSEDVKADCAVVLTGGPGRIQEGMDLLRQGRVRKLIISGVHPGVGLRDIFSMWPLYGDINPSTVILEKHSQTTYGNAQQTLQLVNALECRDIALITSRLHMYRSEKTFAAIFPDHIPIYTRSVVAGKYKHTFSDLMVEATKTLFYSSWAF